MDKDSVNSPEINTKRRTLLKGVGAGAAMAGLGINAVTAGLAQAGNEGQYDVVAETRYGNAPNRN